MNLVMKISAGALLALGATAPLYAQSVASVTPPTGGATLEEVVVTAERRTEDLQKVAASVEVLQGGDLADEGRITTQQILEDLPNVTYAPGLGADNPNGNITIRGVQSTQQTGGNPGPSATATYVDDVYQGIGGDYDISRIEVLRGPQGTLYGRSATGGVVAFHTNDPDLSKFSASVYGEYGTDVLRHGTVVLNMPLGDTLAVRVAGNEVSQDGYYDRYGAQTDTEEGRIKVLYQPAEGFKALLSASTMAVAANAGGNSISLSAPDTYNFHAGEAPIGATAVSTYNQYALSADADLGWGALTYEGSMHTYYRNGSTGYFFVGPCGCQEQTGSTYTPLDQFNSQEIRLASNPGSKLTWLVGGTVYSNMNHSSSTNYQVPEGGVVYGSPFGPDTTCTGSPTASPPVAGVGCLTQGNVFLFGPNTRQSTVDYGVFTEETYPITNDLRVTGGLRYDNTKVTIYDQYLFNINLDSYVNSLNPAINEVFSLNGNDVPGAPGAPSSLSFSNVTYKLRFEYDLSPSSLLYVDTATGFLPGDIQFSPNVSLNFQTLQVSIPFQTLPFAQERLTAYEVGSKNRFFDNKLQVNGDAFYYDYQGYQEAVNIGQGPVPDFVTLAVPLRMVGAELDIVYRPSADDQIRLDGGLLDAQISSFPNTSYTANGVTGSFNDHTYIGLSRLTGVPNASANLSWTHNFTLGNGSKLMPRAEVLYTAAEYVSNLSLVQVTGCTACTHGPPGTPPGNAPSYLPYDLQAAHELVNANVTWSSPKGIYFLDVYGRNIGGTIVKTAVSANGAGVGVTPGAPRTYGVSVNARF